MMAVVAMSRSCCHHATAGLAFYCCGKCISWGCFIVESNASQLSVVCSSASPTKML
jgi:hypothetical protein